jgi:hypothetical protein
MTLRPDRPVAVSPTRPRPRANSAALNGRSEPSSAPSTARRTSILRTGTRSIGPIVPTGYDTVSRPDRPASPHQHQCHRSGCVWSESPGALKRNVSGHRWATTPVHLFQTFRVQGQMSERREREVSRSGQSRAFILIRSASTPRHGAACPALSHALLSVPPQLETRPAMLAAGPAQNSHRTATVQR